MKKVLLIANLGHASPRIPGIAKYLSHFGWKATILTPKMSSKQKELFLSDHGEGLHIVETEGYALHYGYHPAATQPERAPSFLIRFKRVVSRRLKKIVSEIKNYPDSEIAWKKHAVKKAEVLIKENSYATLLSSSSPITCHLIAKEIKKRYSIPWVADLRDLWTQNHNYPFSRIRKVIERKLELNTISSADELVTVSPQLAQQLEALHSRKKVYVITNGFDHYAQGNAERPEKFTLVYTGQIYPGKQNCYITLQAINELIEEKIIPNDAVEFHYFGPTKEMIKEEIARQGSSELCEKYCKLYDPISRTESLKKQLASQLLILFNWEDKTEKGIATTKFYEYLGTGRPIIATGGYGGDFLESLLQKTDAGNYCRSVKEIKECLVSYYSEYTENGYVAGKGNKEAISAFSYKRIAGKLAEIFNRVSEDYQ